MKAVGITHEDVVIKHGINTLTVTQPSDLAQVRLVARRGSKDGGLPNLTLSDKDALTLASTLLARVAYRRRLLGEEPTS